MSSLADTLEAIADGIVATLTLAGINAMRNEGSAFAENTVLVVPPSLPQFMELGEGFVCDSSVWALRLYSAASPLEVSDSADFALLGNVLEALSAQPRLHGVIRGGVMPLASPEPTAVPRKAAGAPRLLVRTLTIHAQH